MALMLKFNSYFNWCCFIIKLIEFFFHLLLFNISLFLTVLCWYWFGVYKFVTFLFAILMLFSHTQLWCLTLIYYFHCSRLLGTPTEQEWPGVSSLRDWHVYPRWEPQNLARAVPSLAPEGVDLLSVSIPLLINFAFCF
jgi:hypothetical protein